MCKFYLFFFFFAQLGREKKVLKELVLESPQSLIKTIEELKILMEQTFKGFEQKLTFSLSLVLKKRSSFIFIQMRELVDIKSCDHFD